MENWRARRISGTCAAAGATSSAARSAQAQTRRLLIIVPRRCGWLFDLSAERLHQLRVARDVALEEARELLDRAALHLVAELGEALVEILLVDHRVDRAVERLDDSRRRTAGDP